MRFPSTNFASTVALLCVLPWQWACPQLTGCNADADCPDGFHCNAQLRCESGGPVVGGSSSSGGAVSSSAAASSSVMASSSAVMSSSAVASSSAHASSSSSSSAAASSGSSSGGNSSSAVAWVWTPGVGGWMPYTTRNLTAVPEGDCCGCNLSTCSQCVANQAVTRDSTSMRFCSGPSEDGGSDHREDTFAFYYPSARVIPHVPNYLHVSVVDLSAAIAGMVNSSMVPADDWRPTWQLSVVELGTVVSQQKFVWGTVECAACSTIPADLGDKTVPAFTPMQPYVDLVLWGRHKSNACNSEAHDVCVALDRMSISTSP